jgi:hypothetical protein
MDRISHVCVLRHVVYCPLRVQFYIYSKLDIVFMWTKAWWLRHVLKNKYCSWSCNVWWAPDNKIRTVFEGSIVVPRFGCLIRVLFIHLNEFLVVWNEAKFQIWNFRLFRKWNWILHVQITVNIHGTINFGWFIIRSMPFVMTNEINKSVDLDLTRFVVSVHYTKPNIDCKKSIRILDTLAQTPDCFFLSLLFLCMCLCCTKYILLSLITY